MVGLQSVPFTIYKKDGSQSKIVCCGNAGEFGYKNNILGQTRKCVFIFRCHKSKRDDKGVLLTPRRAKTCN